MNQTLTFAIVAALRCLEDTGEGTRFEITHLMDNGIRRNWDSGINQCGLLTDTVLSRM